LGQGIEFDGDDFHLLYAENAPKWTPSGNYWVKMEFQHEWVQFKVESFELEFYLLIFIHLLAIRYLLAIPYLCSLFKVFILCSLVFILEEVAITRIRCQSRYLTVSWLKTVLLLCWSFPNYSRDSVAIR